MWNYISVYFVSKKIFLNTYAYIFIKQRTAQVIPRVSHSHDLQTTRTQLVTVTFKMSEYHYSSEILRLAFV